MSFVLCNVNTGGLRFSENASCKEGLEGTGEIVGVCKRARSRQEAEGAEGDVYLTAAGVVYWLAQRHRMNGEDIRINPWSKLTMCAIFGGVGFLMMLLAGCEPPMKKTRMWVVARARVPISGGSHPGVPWCPSPHRY